MQDNIPARFAYLLAHWKMHNVRTVGIESSWLKNLVSTAGTRGSGRSVSGSNENLKQPLSFCRSYVSSLMFVDLVRSVNCELTFQTYQIFETTQIACCKNNSGCKAWYTGFEDRRVLFIQSDNCMLLCWLCSAVLWLRLVLSHRAIVAGTLLSRHLQEHRRQACTF